MNRAQFEAFLRDLKPAFEALSAEEKEQYAERIVRLVQKIEGEIAQEPIEEPPAQPNALPAPAIGAPQEQVSDIARELWTLARGDPDIFSLYAQSFPNDGINRIAKNPQELNALMERINNSQSVPPRKAADGVLQAPLQSSNVYGFRYDPLTKKLTVRFNSGSVYRYDGVPRNIFDMFSHGDGVARTTGKNRWGRWWRGKSPSLGASLHELIKLGGYPYQKIK